MGTQFFRNYSLPLVALLVLTVIALIQPRFVTLDNISNVLRQSSFLLIAALGQMLPILLRGLDLSQGGVIAISSVVFAILSNEIGIGMAAGLTCLMGTLIGILNGSMIAFLRISPFVSSLGLGFSLAGFALILSGGQPIANVPSNFSSLSWGQFLGIPIPVLVAFAVFLLVQIVLSRTLLGRYIYAVGSNQKASILCGIPVKSTILTGYATCAGVTSVAAILLSSRISSGHPTVGADMALNAIAAAVIGGVSLMGGRGTAIGTALGALFLAALGNALNLLNISSYTQQVAVGIAIIIAVVMDRFRVK